MADHLLNLKADKLLEKFGAGNHKPGSGSAAAYQGLLAAQLIRTVINLTMDPKRRAAYQAHLVEMTRIDKEIEERIYPGLARLMQEDSNQFDKVIVLRKSKTAERDPIRKNNKRIESLQALRVATELPIKIAQLCIELAEFASYISDHGFRSARGDSGVALNGAIAAIAGCLSIIDLNLVSFTHCEWTDTIRVELEHCRQRYRQLLRTAELQSDALRIESVNKFQLDVHLRSIAKRARAKSPLTTRDVEAVADDVHRALWQYRQTIWKGKVPHNPEAMLSPKAILTALDFQYRKSTTLGQYQLHGEIVEVAGLIDRNTYRVEISEQFPLETQNFTAAHELGHALMHEQPVLHRDKALDGSQIHTPRDPVEAQADHFAACFLMPSRMTVRAFEQRFKTRSFVLNDNARFALSATDKSTLGKRTPSRGDIAAVLAAASSFDGQFFEPMTKLLSVSKGAMAIRLLELGLVGR
jgi:formiminotetrahydrofolate cyclodeaminase/Zn-dependent peptidase ImmA (M78 family)